MFTMLSLLLLTITTNALSIVEVDSDCPPVSLVPGRCGPLFDNKRCNRDLASYAYFCNEDNGWCGSTSAHGNAQSSDIYDWQPTQCTLGAEVDHSIQLKSQNGLCLVDYGGKASLMTCAGDDFLYEQWVYRSDTKALMNVGSHDCLDIKDDAYYCGADVILYTCTGANNQQWDFDSTYGQIKNVNGCCLDVHSDDFTAGITGARMAAWGCHNGANQQFILPDSVKNVSPPPSGCTLDDYIENAKVCTGRDVGLTGYVSPPVNWDSWATDVAEDSITGVIDIIAGIVGVAAPAAGPAGPIVALVASIANTIISLIFGAGDAPVLNNPDYPFDQLREEIMSKVNAEIAQLYQCMDEALVKNDALNNLQTISRFMDDMDDIQRHYSEDISFVTKLSELMDDMGNFAAEEFGSYKDVPYYESAVDFSIMLPVYTKFTVLLDEFATLYLKFVAGCKGYCRRNNEVVPECPDIDTAVDLLLGDVEDLKQWINAAHDSIRAEYLSIKALSAGTRACSYDMETCDSTNQCDASLEKEWSWAWDPQAYSIKQFGFWPSDNTNYKYNYGTAYTDTTDMDWDYLTSFNLDMSGTKPMLCDLKNHKNVPDSYECNTKVVSDDLIPQYSETEVVSDGCCKYLNYQAQSVVNIYKQDVEDWSHDFYVRYIRSLGDFENKLNEFKTTMDDDNNGYY